MKQQDITKLLIELKQGIVDFLTIDDRLIGKIVRVRQGEYKKLGWPVTLYVIRLDNKRSIQYGRLFRGALHGPGNELKVGDRIEIMERAHSADLFPDSNSCIIEEIPYRRVKEGVVEIGKEKIYWDYIAKYRKLEVLK